METEKADNLKAVSQTLAKLQDEMRARKANCVASFRNCVNVVWGALAFGRIL